jgi:Arc/MetJ family transcription regulator
MTTVIIDDELIREVQRVGKHQTEQEAVDEALQEYIARRKQLQILELFGTIEYEKKYAHKAQRSRA